MSINLFRLTILFPLIAFCLTGLQAQEKEQQPMDTLQVFTLPVTRPAEIKTPVLKRNLRLTDPRLALFQTKMISSNYRLYPVPSFWEKKNILGFNLSEVAFVNWNAGGDNAITAIGQLQFIRNYKFRNLSWQNELEMRFGWNAQEGRKWRKTEDIIRLNSTFGYRRDTLTNWYYSAKAAFRTQFADGFKYPDRSNPISRFMAPGYLFLGAGASYISEADNFNLYLSPLTHRSTFVLDQDLANTGAFGVKKAVFDDMGNVLVEGENVLVSLGLQVTNTWQTQLMKNVALDHRINLYTDYLRDFGNIDIDWELFLVLTVNQHIKTTLGAHVIYDDDILFNIITDDDGNIIDPGEPRIQFRQWLSVGLDYSF